MAKLSREVLLGAKKVPRETVILPELGGEVIVRGMTGYERDAFEASCVEGKGKRREFTMKNLRAKMVAFCCIDESGARLFTDDDANELGQVRADVIDKLFTVARRLSGMSEEDAEQLGEVSARLAVSETSSTASRANSE